MVNRITMEATPELLECTTVNDEYLFRQLAVKLVQDMPLDQLKKLIVFKVTDPFSEESKRIVYDYSQPEWKRNQIRLLQQKRVILYEAVLEQ